MQTPPRFYSLYESISRLQLDWCAPFCHEEFVSEAKPSQSIHEFPQIRLSEKYDLRKLLTNSLWLDLDIKTMTSKHKHLEGEAYSIKYEKLQKDDARSVALNWKADIERALSHISPQARNGNLLHVGSDILFEPILFHGMAKEIFLVDIAPKLLSRVLKASPSAEGHCTSIDELMGIADNSFDLYVALRVFNSVNINNVKAIKQASRVLRPGGSVLLSVSNGYKAIDNTILPGQIKGIPPYMDLSAPFKSVAKILIELSKSGFHELFLVPGETELFLGGTFLPQTKPENRFPILHLGEINSVPLCFYSDLMPTSWLGNYSLHPMVINDVLWPTVEHFFQSRKFDSSAHVENIRALPHPHLAKLYAGNYESEVIADWQEKRLDFMKTGIKAKFYQYPGLKNKLTQTRRRVLIEKSPNDPFWGFTNNKGKNMMGEILMGLRT